jgi:YD repeat-containing protein
VGELGVGEGSSYFSRVYELPDGTVQLSVRDPAGNLVEINWPDVTTLDRSVVAHVEVSQADRTPGSTCGLHGDA